MRIEVADGSSFKKNINGFPSLFVEDLTARILCGVPKRAWAGGCDEQAIDALAGTHCCQSDESDDSPNHESDYGSGCVMAPHSQGSGEEVSVLYLYSFDNDERIILGEDREGRSDAMAIAYGREMPAFGGYRKIEIWLRNARVAVVQKSGVDDELSPVSVETQEPCP